MWGLIVYASLYFNTLDPRINWWASYVPNLRWNLLTSAVVLLSLFLHRDKLSDHKLRSVLWACLFAVLTLIITSIDAVHIEEAKLLSYKLVTYCITMFLIVKCMQTPNQFRGFLLLIILLATNLSIKAYTSGTRINNRLEFIGPGDAFSSNEFGVLLAAIIPFTLPFILRGRRYERIFCILSLPFLLNAFILCNSRGAFVAFVFGVVYVFCFAADKLTRKYIIIAGMCMVPMVLYLADEAFIERTASIWNSDFSNEESRDRVSSGRLEIWKYGLEMVKDYPMGAAPEGFRHIARFYMPAEILKVAPDAEYGVRAAHNSYLQVLVEHGYVGIVIFLLINFHTLYLLTKSNKKMAALGLSGSFWAFCLKSLNASFACSMMGGMFGSQVYYEFFWWQVAISVIAYSFTLKIEKDNTYLKNTE